MDQSELKTESELKTDSVCAKCCLAAFPFFSINNYEFKALFNINCTIDQNRYDKYVFLPKPSKLTANLNKNDFFYYKLHFNTRSFLKNKVDNFYNFLIDLERMHDATAISETKLNVNSSLNLNFPNYRFIRNESISYRGVGRYIKDSLKFCIRKNFALHLQHCEVYGLKLH